MTTTNLDNVKNIAIAFLYYDIEETPFSPTIVQHPIFESGIQCVNIHGDYVNLLEDKEGLDKIRKRIEDRIRNAQDAADVFIIIRKSYRLAFLKFTRSYLSQKDFSELLAYAWVSSYG